MHTAATPRPYLSRRQKSTCSHVDYATLRKSVSTTDERTTSTTTSRINRKNQGDQAEQCCAPVFNYGRTLGQPSRTVELNERSDRRETTSTRISSTRKSADWPAMLCTALYTSKLLDQSLTELFTIKCVVPNSGIIVPFTAP